MELDRILKDLSFYTEKFPRRAVEEAIKAEEEITPKLLEILENTIEKAKNGSGSSNAMGHLYALYLLSQFREKRAYPLTIELFSLPGDIVEDLLGDSLTEDGSRMLASVCSGNLEPMRSLVENEEAYEYARGAALEAILNVEINRGNRQNLIEYYKDLFRRLPRNFDYIWCYLVSCCADIYPEELYDEIKQAFQDDLVDEWWINLEDIKRTLKKTKENVLDELKNSKKLKPIENTVEEMEWWATFQAEIPSKSKPVQTEYSSRSFAPLPANVPIRKEKKIGRNEPCPCGSGKKYKKCCGRNQ